LVVVLVASVVVVLDGDGDGDGDGAGAVAAAGCDEGVALGEVVGSSAQAMLAAQTQYITATDKRIALTPIALEGPSSRPCDYSEAVERSLQGS
jgi:hypothetical protein